jgi:hypothetical protein
MLQTQVHTECVFLCKYLHMYSYIQCNMGCMIRCHDFLKAARNMALRAEIEWDFP